MNILFVIMMVLLSIAIGALIFGFVVYGYGINGIEVENLNNLIFWSTSYFPLIALT